jgi:hypothetical protein
MFKRDFFELLQRVGNIILLLLGIILLPSEVFDKTHSAFLRDGSLVILFILLGSLIVYHLLPYPTQRRFGLNKYRTTPILVHDNEHISIDDHFKALIETEKEIVYANLPPEDDRVDIIEIAANESFDNIHYYSKDSRITKKIKRKNNCIAFYWEPLSPIIPYCIYKHHTEYISPSDYGDDAFFHIHHIDIDTGVIDYTFKCSHRVELAVAFTLPYFKTEPRYKLLDKLTFITKKRDCPQPILSDDLKTIKWKLTAPKINRSYAIFVVYEGQTSLCRSRIDRRIWIFRKLFPIHGKVA